MAHFVGRNTEVKKGETWESLPVQTDFAEFITGSFYAEEGGILQVQQSFEYPKNHEDDEKAAEVHWDVVTKVALTKAEAEEGHGVGFQIFALAPYFRLVFINESEADNHEFRAYARAQEKGRL